MPFAVECPCGKTIRVRDELRGRHAKCPACGQRVALEPPAAERDGKPAPEIDALFREVIRQRGSNLHLKVGQPPVIRINGLLTPMDVPALTESQVIKLCVPLLDKRHETAFHRDGGTDLAHLVEQDGVTWRFRVNLFRQLGTMAMIAQTVQPFIPDIAALHLPSVIERLCQFDQGMILVAGMTGTGKTTTIAAMLDWINHNYHKHILTIEDPIEYVFDDDHCLVNQREIGENVKDFATAMKHAVREDPDVMLVGEMRDRESFSTALHAAETGHLVFGTVHAPSPAGSIARILDLFPHAMHTAIRSSMTFNVKAIISQKLVPTICDEPKRVPIVELMIFTPTIRKLILQAEDAKLPAAIRNGRPEGMQQFEDSLLDFVNRGYISRAAAIEAAPNPESFKMKIKGINVQAGGLI